ncbi:putative SOS response associated peptidase (SRAP) [Dioscorea sansibarensis]
MCGRARCTLDPQQIAQACGFVSNVSVPTLQLDRYRPSYNVSPGAYLPVVAARKDGESPVVIHCMKWGLVPSFTKKTEKPDHFRMFNARSESVKEKASFRRLMPNNRCLVAVEGFYEWKKDGSKKQPYYIHFKDHRPLIFAGLYDSWENPEGDILYTFTILTTRCSSALRWLHDRMPVILAGKGSIDKWLDNSMSKPETLWEPYEDSDLVWYPVTPAIGKTTFDGPECIKEVQLKPAGENPLSKFFTKMTDDKYRSKPGCSDPFRESLLTEVKEDEFGAKEKEESIGNGRRSADVSIPLKNEPVDNDAPRIKQEFEEIATDPELNTEKMSNYFIKNRAFPGEKRELEETGTDSGQTTEKVSNFTSNPVKKGRSNKNSGDKQATLLSYFGKS